MLERPALRALPEIAAALALAWIGVFFLQAHYGFGAGDEGLLWYVSQRTASGELPLRDWYAYEPARYWWSAAWFNVLGDDGLLQQRFANLAFASIALAAVVVAARDARLAPALRISLVVLLCLMLGFPQHKLYEQSLSLALVALVYVALRTPGWRVFALFGLATGVAACFGKNSGVYFAIAAVLAWCVAFVRGELRGKAALRAVFACGIGTFAGYAPMLVLSATDPAFRSAYIDSIVLAPQWQLKLPIPWPWTQDWSGEASEYQRHLRALGLLCVLVPAVYGLAAATSLRLRTRTPLHDFALAAAIAGLPWLHHAFDRADFGHVTQGAMPVAIAAAALVGLWLRRRSAPAIAGAVALSLATTLAVFAVWWPLQPRVAHAAHPEAYATLRDGDTTFEVPAAFTTLVDAARASLAHCAPRDGVLLVAPHSPGLYAWLRLRAPYWELYYLHKRSADTQHAHIAALARAHTAVAIVDPAATFDERDDLRLHSTYPLLLDHLRTHYQRARVDGTRETWLLPGGCALAPR